MMFILAGYDIVKLPLITFLTFVLWAVSVLIGYLVPVRRNVFATDNVIRVLTIVLVVLPPIYYPLTAWPPQVRILAYAIPTFNVSELIKMI